MFKNLMLDRPLAVLDLETTGIDTDNDRIIEISILKVKPDGTTDQKTRRCNPTVPIPPGASEVHGIYDHDVADEPTFSVLSRAILKYLDGCDLAGFNILGYDLKLLVAEFVRCGIDFPMVGRRVIDAKTIYHKMEPRDLTAAYRHYCGEEHVGAHGAAADVLATALILDAQVSRYEGLPRTVHGLHNHFRDPAAVDMGGMFSRVDGVVTFAKGKHKGRALPYVAANDSSYLRWMLGQNFLPDTKDVVRAALGLDRARGVG